MNSRTARATAFVIGLTSFAALAVTDAPLWAYAITAVFFLAMVGYLNRRFPFEPHLVELRRATQLPVYAAASIAIAGLAIAAAIVKQNALLGAGGVAAAIILLGAIWATKDGPD